MTLTDADAAAERIADPSADEHLDDCTVVARAYLALRAPVEGLRVTDEQIERLRKKTAKHPDLGTYIISVSETLMDDLLADRLTQAREIAGLRAINSELCHSHNLLLGDGAKWQVRATAAESRVAELNILLAQARGHNGAGVNVNYENGPHPRYGPCDAFGPGGSCAQCAARVAELEKALAELRVVVEAADALRAGGKHDGPHKIEDGFGVCKQCYESYMPLEDAYDEKRAALAKPAHDGDGGRDGSRHSALPKRAST